MSGITNSAEEYFKDGLWAWVTDQWKKLVADASGFLQINIAAQDIDIEVKQTTAADLTPGVCGWDGSAWRKLPLLWGFSDRWYENLGGTKSGAGSYSDYSTAVPAGYVYVLQTLSARNVTSDPGLTQLRVYAGASWVVIVTKDVAKDEALVWTGSEIVLKEGDKVRIFMETCLNLDVIEAGVWGYQMKIAE